MPKNWSRGLIVPMWKRKVNVYDPRRYRGIKFRNNVMKVLGRIPDGRIRKSVEREIGEE